MTSFLHFGAVNVCHERDTTSTSRSSFRLLLDRTEVGDSLLDALADIAFLHILQFENQHDIVARSEGRRT